MSLRGRRMGARIQDELCVSVEYRVFEWGVACLSEGSHV